MKIAILSCFYPYRGGISQFNACMLQELSKKHTVKAFNFKRQYPNILFPGKTQYVSKEDNAVPVESTALLDTANPFSYIRTAKEISRWKPDLLIMRYWMSWFAPSLGYVARHLPKECKVISILDNVVPHEPRFFDKPFTKYFLKPQDGFITLCNAVAEDLLKFMPNANYLVTPHPLYSHFGEKIDKASAHNIIKSGLNPDKKTILFFGLIREYKGLDILIKSFSLLDKSYQLIIAGEPYGSFEPYQKLINQSPNRENIFVNTNYIEDNRVNGYFCASDICVLPYRSATQSGISSISYHFNLPLITTNVGGLKETIEKPGTGIVVDQITPEAIANAIKEYFNTPDISTNMVNSIKKEKERLSWTNFCEKVESLYNRI